MLLRSMTPDLIRQELYGLTMAHFAIRSLMYEAALKAEVDPDRLSFILAVRVVRRTLPHFAARSPQSDASSPTPPSSRNERKTQPAPIKCAPTRAV
jgi:hypothetical protein